MDFLPFQVHIIVKDRTHASVQVISSGQLSKEAHEELKHFSFFELALWGEVACNEVLDLVRDVAKCKIAVEVLEREISRFLQTGEMPQGDDGGFFK